MCRPYLPPAYEVQWDGNIFSLVVCLSVDWEVEVEAGVSLSWSGISLPWSGQGTPPFPSPPLPEQDTPPSSPSQDRVPAPPPGKEDMPLAFTQEDSLKFQKIIAVINYFDLVSLTDFFQFVKFL